MPVDTPHDDYLDRAPDWRLCRDVVAGRRAVNRGKTTYLDKLSGQTDDQYAAYQKRAGWYDATSRTLDGLGGMVFRKDPLLDLPPAAGAIKMDLTNGGKSLRAVSERAIDEVLTTNRYGILVDFPDFDASGLSQAEYEQSGARPKAALYPAESIIYWEYSSVGGVQRLSKVRLKETVATQSAADEFAVEESEQYRVLELTAEGYQQRIFTADSGTWVEVQTIVPLLNGARLDYIPFEICTADSNPETLGKPPILGLAEANIDHYRMEADHKHGLHYTALPTPVFLGADQPTDENGDAAAIKIGSGEALFIPSDGNTRPDCKFLEFTGAGLAALQVAIQDKKQEMATLGARMISQDKRVGEAAETAQIHRQGENSVLAGAAKSVSASLTRVVGWMLEWAGISGEYRVELNTDFMPVSIDPQQMAQLLAAVQAGEISRETYFWNLKKGEIIAQDREFEDERESAEATI